MAKVLLIAPSMEGLYGKIKLRKFRWGCLPYGLACIAGFLKQKNHDIRLIDATYEFDNRFQLKSLILNEQPEFVGISVTTPLLIESLYICNFIKENLPQTRTILGGPHPSALPQETMSHPTVDMVVFGEGEYTLQEILEGKDPKDIKGLCYRSNGEIKMNPARPLIDDLDSLPFPLFEQLPIDRYGLPYMGKSVGIITSRGCPYNCTFCASGVVHGHRSRFRSVDRVLDEISYLKTSFSVNTIIFCDDTFETNIDRVFDFCTKLINRKLNIKWCCTSRANDLTDELLKIMKTSGCKLIHIGIESANQEILDKTGKGINLQKAKETVRRIKMIGLEVYGYFILGLPYETEKTIQETIKFSRDLDFDYAQFSILTPLPGTKVWAIMKEGKALNYLGKDWTDFKRYSKDIFIELEHVSREKLQKYYRKSYRSFYFRLSYLWKTIKKIGSFSDFFRVLKMIEGMLFFTER